ncbi:phage tail assembly protein [Roseomonas nepalensis]|uniref:Phage tail assembly protein n=1 Tax=Muricoccus nepalensis TaxID=1854500 RepID=A0A502FV57_9PROT|nr:phage tail assembly protein [Roseomonas nepalensis]TPG53270.1 phage tail assembly protein [Roseomonas nepalensis]
MSDDTEEAAFPATLTITLDPPVHFSGKDYTEVTLREPSTQQFADAQDLGGIRSVQHLVHVVGGVPKAVAALIPISKTMQADAFFAHFTRPAPATSRR